MLHCIYLRLNTVKYFWKNGISDTFLACKQRCAMWAIKGDFTFILNDCVTCFRKFFRLLLLWPLRKARDQVSYVMMMYHTHIIFKELRRICSYNCAIPVTSIFSIAAVNRGVYYVDSQMKGLEIASPDAALVNILTADDFVTEIPLPSLPISDVDGVAFNMYNNVWETNYIFWYPYRKEDTDQKFRFRLNFLWSCNVALFTMGRVQ